MPMTTAGNQTSLGEYLYFFQSPVPNTDQCLILGHAGWVPRLADEFTLPEDVSLHFRSWHGFANTSSPKLEILRGGPQTSPLDRQLGEARLKAARMMVDEKERRDFVGGSRCYDYVVIKGLGKHWSKRNPNDASYTAIAQTMATAGGAGACMHFVSVRNRRFYHAKKYVLLSEVIDQVRDHDDTITRFVMAGCRGVEAEWQP
jgi:hypothetical protein